MRKSFWVIILVTNLVVLPALYFTAKTLDKTTAASQSLPVFARLDKMSFSTAAGASFGMKELRQRIWIVDFIFTRCPNQCPAMTLKMKALSGDLSKIGVGLLSITVDPEFDTAERLAEYQRQEAAEAAEWYFLTGSKSQISQVMEAMHLGAPEEPAAHSLRFVLVDPEGGVRGYYDYSDPDLLARILNDCRKLQKEIARGKSPK